MAMLEDSGQHEELIREAQIMLGATTDADERASLLIKGIVSCQILGRIEEARGMLGQLQQLDIPDLEGRLNAEFCEPRLLEQEKKLEEAVAAFAAILLRHGAALQEPRFRYLYEDIQSRRATALLVLDRFKEAQPILREAISFSFDDPAEEQRKHYWLGVCLEDAKESESARSEYLRVIGFNLKDDLEESARYRLAMICYLARGFAQARLQLETIIRDHPDGNFFVEPEYVYQGLSQVCRELGDAANAKHYMHLAAGSRKTK